MTQAEQAPSRDWVVFAATGRIDAHTAPEFERACHSRVASGVRLAIDLSAVNYLSSAGMRALLSTLKRVRAASGELVLLKTQPPVREVLAIAGFTSLFSLVDSLPA